jgi:biopolymer transport protein ExbB
MMMEQEFGIAYFISQCDSMGKGVLALLLLLSIASWYLIVTKAVANLDARRRTDAFLRRFWDASSLQEMQATLGASGDDYAFSVLARQALTVGSGNLRGAGKLLAAGGMAEYLTRVMSSAARAGLTRIGFVTDPAP